MKPRETRESGDQDLFRSRLDQIIDMQHQLVKLGKRVNWKRLEAVCGKPTGRVRGCRPCRRG